VDTAEGAPVGIQILGRSMKDEETLEMARIISDVLRR
jgi:Asp-tRNA(Asn)/Glu-tRNA(Gln) amidotransferase A subunit family amidase